jgi:hypothetical protein
VHESLADFASNSDLKGWVSADNIEDTKPLHDEISKLRSEIELIKKSKSVAYPLKQSTNQKQDAENFDSIERVLKSISIDMKTTRLPLTPESPPKINLMDLFYACRERLINGITNRPNEVDLNRFLVEDLCSKLTIHGLVDSEKVPGYLFRRFFVTKKGCAFLANFEMKNYPEKISSIVDD